VLSLLVLVCLGLCLGEFLTCLIVGGYLESRGVPRFGRWCRHAFFDVLKERNNRCFENLERSLDNILASFLHTLYFWTVAFVSPLLLSFGDFLHRFFISN
jgi:hypothetical protein